MPINCTRCGGTKKIAGMGGILSICGVCKGLGRIADPKIMEPEKSTRLEKVFCDECKKEIENKNKKESEIDFSDAPILNPVIDSEKKLSGIKIDNSFDEREKKLKKIKTDNLLLDKVELAGR